MIYQINRQMYDTLRDAYKKTRNKSKEEVIAIINQQGRFIKKVTDLKIKN